MLTKLKSVAYLGVDCIGVDVEVNVAPRGMPCFDIVGLPNKEIAESKQRVRTALQNSGIVFPSKRITVNLAPADIPKEGSFYDLPIAVGILADSLGLTFSSKALFFGELSLDGSLRYTRGSLMLALYAHDYGYDTVFLPDTCFEEASAVKNVRILPLRSLADLITFFKSGSVIGTPNRSHVRTDAGHTDSRRSDFSSILGHSVAKRCLEIAAAGGHSLLMVGPPGSGKTLLAQSFPSILPPMTDTECIEVTKIHSVSGNFSAGQSLMTARPFRTPNHTITHIGMIGGGVNLYPGEVTLAHRGVLFLDELAEFPRNVIEALRLPLEAGEVTTNRHGKTLRLPAQFTLLAASNLCPCGYYGHPTIRCVCTANQVNLYKKKFSGPILDRIDLCINVLPLKTSEYTDSTIKTLPESSQEVQKRVTVARHVQQERFKKSNIVTNSEMKNDDIKCYCSLNNSAQHMLTQAVSKYNLSTRAYFKILRIARTISDLDLCVDIGEKHLSEALQYRNNPTVVS